MGRKIEPPELARDWSTSVGQLANMRSQGKGPAYLKIGRKVLYDTDDVAAYEVENRIEAARAGAAA